LEVINIFQKDPEQEEKPPLLLGQDNGKNIIPTERKKEASFRFLGEKPTPPPPITTKSLMGRRITSPQILRCKGHQSVPREKLEFS